MVTRPSRIRFGPSWRSGAPGHVDAMFVSSARYARLCVPLRPRRPCGGLSRTRDQEATRWPTQDDGRASAPARRTARARGAGGPTPSRTTAASSRPPRGCSRRIPTPASTPSPPRPASAAPPSTGTSAAGASSSRSLAATRQDAADANEHDALRPAGELDSGGPSPLDVADVLNKVPPHLLGEQIVAEAQRIAGVSSVALYLVDIDGSRLLRTAGSAEFPEELAAPLAVGPEIPRAGIPGLRRLIEQELPGSVPAPLYLRGRAIGLLLAVRSPQEPLAQLARQAAAALELARDLHRRLRRRAPPQGHQRRRGGPAGHAAATHRPHLRRHARRQRPAQLRGRRRLVRLRREPRRHLARHRRRHRQRRRRRRPRRHRPRRVPRQPPQRRRPWSRSWRSMHETIARVGGANDSVAVTIARWHGASLDLHLDQLRQPAPHAHRRGRRTSRSSVASRRRLGTPEPHAFTVDQIRVLPGERIVLASDGVTGRPTGDGTPLGTGRRPPGGGDRRPHLGGRNGQGHRGRRPACELRAARGRRDADRPRAGRCARAIAWRGRSPAWLSRTPTGARGRTGSSRPTRRAPGVRVGPDGAAAVPGVAAAVDGPGLGDRCAVGVVVHGAAVRRPLSPLVIVG